MCPRWELHHRVVGDSESCEGADATEQEEVLRVQEGLPDVDKRRRQSATLMLQTGQLASPLSGGVKDVPVANVPLLPKRVSVDAGGGVER